MNKIGLIVFILIIQGCKPKLNVNSSQITEVVDEDKFELRIHQVYRLRDELTNRIINNLPDIKNYSSITNIKDEDYLDNFIGTTNSKLYKEAILDTLLSLLSNEKSVIPVWSKNTIDDQIKKLSSIIYIYSMGIIKSFL